MPTLPPPPVLSKTRYTVLGKERKQGGPSRETKRREEDLAASLGMSNKARARFLMLEGWTDKAIAEELGVNRRTVYGYRKDNDFERRLKIELELRNKYARIRIQSLIGVCIDTLRDMVVGTVKVVPTVRLKAIALLMEKAGPVFTTETVQAGVQDQEKFNELVNKLADERAAVMAEERAAEMVKDLARGKTITTRPDPVDISD